ncbi:MAG: hypothetical protein ABW022_16145 [Actinoplanes sp.]
MAAVSGPGFSDTAPPTEAPRRRWWIGGLVAVWIVVLAGLAVWSVGSSPPTVPEQRDIAQALPKLQEATGTVFAAAGGPGRAVVLGGLAMAEGCRITGVRDGVLAVRDIVVHVRAGEARTALEAIAAALPAGYAADVATSRGGTEVSLHADAGNFIGIDADAKTAAQAVTFRVSTGCRPLGAEASVTEPSAGSAPEALAAVLAKVGAADGAAVVSAVNCPAGGAAATYAVDEIAAPADLERRLTGSIRNGPDVWAYRTGNDSVVVTREDSRLRVEVSTGC